MVKQLSEVSGFTENPVVAAGSDPGAASALEEGSPPPSSAPGFVQLDSSVPGEQLPVADQVLQPSSADTSSIQELATGVSEALQVISGESSPSVETLPDVSPDNPSSFFQRVLGNRFYEGVEPAPQRPASPAGNSRLAQWALGSSESGSGVAIPEGSSLSVALPFVKTGEAFYAEAYPDPGSRDGTPWTIGYGQTTINGRPVRPGDKISRGEAERWVTNELLRVENFVKSKVSVPLTTGQLAALVSFTYNVGDGAFSKSTLLKKLNAGDYDSVPSEMRKWVNNDGKFMQGLLNRRNNEINQLWLAQA